MKDWNQELDQIHREQTRLFLEEKQEVLEDMKKELDLSERLRKMNLDRITQLTEENERLKAQIIKLEAEHQLKNI